MSNILISLFAYFTDKLFGEFRFIKHPIIIIGEMITFFEKRFYKNSILRGLLLVLFVLSLVSFISISIYLYLSEMNDAVNIIISSFIASMFLAHRMLYDSVKDVLVSQNKQEVIAKLVSRDVEQMSESDIYKASIETYAENLSDGVIAPLFYLLLFGLPGIIIYKAINTMDSMVGYRNDKYENYGKVAAKLDDIANYIPSRVTAVLIMLLFKQKDIFSFYENGAKHDSPNAGHPITAMAMSLDISLGGDTYYFGKLKEKPYFGSGRIEIKESDVRKALSLRGKVDSTVAVLLLAILVTLQVL
ncbi:cobalamin biosynthesis protein [Sulfurimonas gotlandica GD1]|jgi:adenosylcobinamide-phosphate synthase|uniref:Cobalamin biosynthesis protein CobD n=1 Tax=Sulfurimonas gotlandica (strain DSM 19862 / JCM 16533 / GD1) TaxID=929558 RepID=B6BH68_SULGG|nr:adenosylcobinamide-phosphate synthase CbiB [Sulfurimonas gotlandica]EDZ63284.1 cobalamin biosynthesis protein CobD [Sulfurimonas gotlandica GD1]EHP29857.1 cobalamin biosynthesis protein [Sulfurimonas gotlandica GD1]